MDKQEIQEDIEKLEEEGTQAADSLRPASRPANDPKSKIEYMQAAIGFMNAMRKDDLSKWFNDSIAQIGTEAQSIPNGAAQKNAATVAMKSTVKEDVEQIFGDQELSEEFKSKATTLFEAAVGAAVAVETARLEEEFEAKLTEAAEQFTNEFSSDIIEKLDAYLDYSVSKFMEENKVAIESSLKTEVVEEFLDGMKNLFAEHYINIPTEKVDVVEALTNKVETLEKALNEKIEESVELKRTVLESQKAALISSMAADFPVMTDQEKFKALAEGVAFDDDMEAFTEKLKVVKEGFFEKKTPTKKMELVEEAVEGEEGNTTVVYTDPVVKRYAEAIKRTVKH